MSRDRRRLAAALLTALAACLAPIAPAGASVTGPATGRLPAVLLTSVSCPGKDSCWAVGTATASREHPVLDHWNGSAWASVRAPVPRTASGLWSVSCASPAFCWAVGSYGPNQLHAFAERWNGSRWSWVPLPVLPGGFAAVSDDVWCSSTASCWELQGYGPAEFEHWNGRAWAVAPAPAFPRGDKFTRVTCVSDRDCWMVGAQPNYTGTISGHWDGKSWSAVPTPAARGGQLLGISCPGASCLAVGGTYEPYHPLAERWTGAAWRITPVAPAIAELTGVACVTARYCVATGLHTSPGGLALSERWNGSRWHAVPVQAPPGSSSAALAAVDCLTTADCWAVGFAQHDGTEPSLIEHWNGTAWSVAAG